VKKKKKKYERKEKVSVNISSKEIRGKLG